MLLFLLLNIYIVMVILMIILKIIYSMLGLGFRISIMVLPFYLIYRLFKKES